MKALFVISGDYQNDNYFICPFCQANLDNIDDDDYVDDNIMIWCEYRHCEMLICPSKYDVDILREGKTNSECTVKLTYKEAVDYLKSIDYKDELEDLPNMYYYLVSIMNIKCLVQPFDARDSSDEESDEEELTNYAKLRCEKKGIEVNVTNFSQLPMSIDSSHDGCYLYYNACCTECNRETYSRISGD